MKYPMEESEKLIKIIRAKGSTNNDNYFYQFKSFLQNNIIRSFSFNLSRKY